MDKQEIKKVLLNAVLQSPHFEAIKRVAIFGSHVVGTPRQDSDLDILIDSADASGHQQTLQR